MTFCFWGGPKKIHKCEFFSGHLQTRVSPVFRDFLGKICAPQRPALKKKTTTTRAGGVSLSCLSSEKKRRRSETTNNVVNPDPKTERMKQKTRPDMKRLFKALPGRNCKKIREKHRQILTKNTRTKESKNKSSHPKVYRTNRPSEEENSAKKRERTRTRPPINTSEKNGQHFPLKKGESKRTIVWQYLPSTKRTHLCDSTVAAPTSSSGPYFGGQWEEVGGALTPQDR